MDAVRPPDVSVEHAIIDSQVIGRGYSNHRKERHAATWPSMDGGKNDEFSNLKTTPLINRAGHRRCLFVKSFRMIMFQQQIPSVTPYAPQRLTGNNCRFISSKIMTADEQELL